MKTRRVILALVVLMAVSVPLLAQGTYTQIDVPGASNTYCAGIDKAGGVTGSYADSDGRWHGFFLRNGTYRFFDYPGGEDTQAYEGPQDVT